MSEPTVSYPVRDVLTRIEKDVAQVRTDVHQMQLALASGSAVVAAEKADAAALRARVALWVAGVSPPVSALLAWLITRK